MKKFDVEIELERSYTIEAEDDEEAVRKAIQLWKKDHPCIFVSEWHD